VVVRGLSCAAISWARSSALPLASRAVIPVRMERTFMAQDFPHMTVVDIGHKARDWVSWHLKFEVIFLFGGSFDCGLPDFTPGSFQVFRYVSSYLLDHYGHFLHKFLACLGGIKIDDRL
jgi:hypothetical protein